MAENIKVVCTSMINLTHLLIFCQSSFIVVLNACLAVNYHFTLIMFSRDIVFIKTLMHAVFFYPECKRGCVNTA